MKLTLGVWMLKNRSGLLLLGEHMGRVLARIGLCNSIT